MASLKIENIVSYLKSVSAITNLVWQRIYYWEPMREQTGPYIIINQVWQNIVDTVTKSALLEIRIVWNDENVTKKQLVNIIDIVESYIITTNSYQKYIDTTFKIVEWWSFEILVDSKNRQLLIKNYIFYFLS